MFPKGQLGNIICEISLHLLGSVGPMSPSHHMLISNGNLDIYLKSSCLYIVDISPLVDVVLAIISIVINFRTISAISRLLIPCGGAGLSDV